MLWCRSSFPLFLAECDVCTELAYDFWASSSGLLGFWYRVFVWFHVLLVWSVLSISESNHQGRSQYRKVLSAETLARWHFLGFLHSNSGNPGTYLRGLLVLWTFCVHISFLLRSLHCLRALKKIVNFELLHPRFVWPFCLCWLIIGVLCSLCRPPVFTGTTVVGAYGFLSFWPD